MPVRLLEMLTDRFGVFEALSMDPQVAEAVMVLAHDLRTARAASGAWAAIKRPGASLEAGGQWG